MKIATWNVNSLKVRLPHVLDWLAAETPDVLALQETKLIDDNFPTDAIREAGYEVRFTGQKTYNGVALLASSPPEDVLTEIAGTEAGGRRILAATVQGVRVVNLYVVNGQAVESEKYTYKLEWLARVRDHLASELARHPKLVVLGDFNIAPDDRDVHDPEAWRESVLCSTPERDALRELTSLGLEDTFRLFDQPEQTFSWWDYRAGAFRRNRGLRIDLILASAPLAATCRRCWVDVEPRRLERPSDHAPVVAEFGAPQ